MNRREAAPEAPGCDHKNGRGKPDPKEFALKNFETAIAEKPSDTNRRHPNGSPREKISLIVERGEEGDSQTAVGHGVQETMAGGDKEEVNPKGKSRK